MVARCRNGGFLVCVCVFLGKELHTGHILVMKDDGLVVRSRAVRERSNYVTMETLGVLRSTPHDPTATMYAERWEIELVRPRDGQTAGEGEEIPRPRRIGSPEASSRSSVVRWV